MRHVAFITSIKKIRIQSLLNISSNMKQFLLLLTMLFSLSCTAQKAFKPVKTALKDKKYNEAITQIEKLRTDSTFKNNTRLCTYAIEAYRGLNDAENTKIYLKKSYDTLAFFSTTRELITTALRLDSIENVLLHQNGDKPKQKHLVCSVLSQYYPNINAAARFYYSKSDYNNAMKFLRLSIDLPHSEIGTLAKLPVRVDTTNSVLYLISAYNAKKYNEVHRYQDTALQAKSTRHIVLRCLALNAEAENDTTNYHKYLYEGWKAYPSEAFFFTRLADFYNKHKHYERTLNIAREQLQSKSLYNAAYLARCATYYEIHSYDSCIVNARNLIAIDSTNAEAHYYIGASYIQKVEMVAMPQNTSTRNYNKALAQRRALFAKAEPELELFRRMAPQSQSLWAPLLYKIYLELNRGDKFAEIEKLLKESK